MSLVLVFLSIAFASAHFFGDAPIFTPKKSDIPALESSTSATILMLYAPWCGHCKHLAPEFAQAAKSVNGKAVFAAVDCEDNRDICAQYGVQGYPTVKLFDAQHGHSRRTPRDYNGPREAKAIENTMYSMIPDWIEKLPADIKDERAVILFSDKPKRTLMFKSLAMHFDGIFKFYDAGKDDEQMSKYGVTKFPTLITVINGEAKTYEGALDLNSIMEYLTKLSGGAKPSENKESTSKVPYVNVHVMNDEMFTKQCDGKACLIMIFGEEEDKELTQSVAKSLEGKMHTLSFTCAEQNEVCNKLNVFYDTPTALVYIPQRGRLVRFVGGFDTQSVILFAKDTLLGRTSAVSSLKEFPHFIDRIQQPYVAPKYNSNDVEDY